MITELNLAHLFHRIIIIIIIIIYQLKGELCTRFWWGNLRERDYWGDQDVDGRIILRWILRKWEGVWGLDGGGSG